jgi:hypothetical protein
MRATPVPVAGTTGAIETAGAVGVVDGLPVLAEDGTIEAEGVWGQLFDARGVRHSLISGTTGMGKNGSTAAVCAPGVLAGPQNDRRVSNPLLTKDGWIPAMAAVKGRQHRTGVADTVFLGVRVSPANFAKLDRAATALGISKAALVDALLSREEVDDQGRPLHWDSPVPRDQEVLPLSESA